MKKLWVHIGMPKAASTAIQYFLSHSLENYERRALSFEDVSELVQKKLNMENALERNWVAQPPNNYSPMAFRSGDNLLISSENFSYFPATSLQGLNLWGMAVIRNPAEWIPSMASQDLLLSIPSNFQDTNSCFSSGMISPEDQLVALMYSYTENYLKMLDNLRTWADLGDGMRVIPYSSSKTLFPTIARELGRLGVNVDSNLRIPQIRVSYPFASAQLALSIYLSSRYEFARSRISSCRLSRLAISVNPLLYQDRLCDISETAHGYIVEQLQRAHESYLSFMNTAGYTDISASPKIPKLQVLDQAFSELLTSSVIRASLGYVQVPEGFDAEAYLALNPELSHIPTESGERQLFATEHYQSKGFLEARPVPRLET
jgi:hypothetical protein